MFFLRNKSKNANNNLLFGNTYFICFLCASKQENNVLKTVYNCTV